MTARLLSDSARIEGHPARRRRTGRVAALLGTFLWAAATVAPVSAQKGVAVTDELVAKLRECTDQTDDTALRGEAALALATLGDPTDAGRFRTLVAERGPDDLRARGAVALSILAQPGAESTLGRLLTESDPRDPMRSVGAFGLGLLPAGQVTPALDEWSNRLRGANRRTESGPLAALAAAAALCGRKDRQTLLASTLQDASWKDPDLRAALVETLHALEFPFTVDQLEKLLDDDEPAVRRAALSAVDVSHADLRNPIYRLLRTSRLPEERAASLEALTELRSSHALTAVEVLADTGETCQLEAAVRCGLRLGGLRLRETLASHVATARSRDARLRAYLVWHGDVPARLRDAAETDLDDARLGLSMRVAAAGLLLRDPAIGAEVHEKLHALLSLALRDGREAETLAAAVRGLRTLGATPDDLASRWTPHPEDLDRLAARIAAAQSCEQPELAAALLETALTSPHAEPADVRAALRAYWRARQPELGPFAQKALEEPIRSLWAESDAAR